MGCRCGLRPLSPAADHFLGTPPRRPQYFQFFSLPSPVGCRYGRINTPGRLTTEPQALRYDLDLGINYQIRHAALSGLFGLALLGALSTSFRTALEPDGPAC